MLGTQGGHYDNQIKTILLCRLPFQKVHGHPKFKINLNIFNLKSAKK